jgi:hypothetical protein
MNRHLGTPFMPERFAKALVACELQISQCFGNFAPALSVAALQASWKRLLQIIASV